MSINRSGSQIYFENLFKGANGIPFKQISKKKYEQTTITKQQAEDLEVLLENEVASYYYKALLSYMESIPAIKNKLFSWATVRLYYSVFYSVKAFLACNNIAMLLAERRLFYIKAKEGETFKRCDDMTDHKGTILTLCKIFKNTEMLLTNNIDGMDAYQWMMKKREEVNYRDMDFHDPNPPEFWEMINEEIENLGIKSVIEKLVNDNWLYCFQEEYAILAVPTKRLITTVKEIKKAGKTITIPNDKKKLIEELAKELSPDSIRNMIIWT